MRGFLWVLGMAAVFAMSCTLTWAQAAVSDFPAAMKGYETVKLADGIYAFISPESNGAIVTGNSVAIIGDEGVLVVDSRWLPIAAERMIFDEEIPRPPKAQPRYIPAAVLGQLNSHLGNLKAPWMQMVLVLQECGMRISELLQLPLDCLTQDARGTFYLRYMQGKMKREHTIPVSQEIVRVVQEQQQVVRATGRSTTLLFPNSKGGVSKQQSFAQRINRLAYDHQIRDANGKLFRFQSHQFRHTVGTRMINLGVPHHFIQRYLGHLGPEMTNRYAHIHDTTGQNELRGRIVRSRRITTDFVPSASASRDRERASKQNILATLRLRIKNLEEKNHELTGLLELVYGELALAREKHVSIGSSF
jgi:hypothetical protein